MKLAGSLIPLLLLAAACGHDFEPPDPGERPREAEFRYTPGLFDSISWPSQDERLLAGNEVYAAKCSRCHGPLGHGDTPYARGRRLDVPSLVEPDWPFADLDSVRHRVFIGHEEGMPTFGVGGITPREIDAASHYVLAQLRVDAVAGSRDGGR